MNDTPIINLRGEKVALGPLSRELIPLFVKWINDFDVTRTLTVGNRPVTQEDEQAWYDKVSGPDTRSFVIYDGQTLQPVGVAGILHINLLERSCEFGIMIGEKSAWGKGFGTETAKLCAGYAFRALSLHNVMLTVQADNERAIRAYRRAGFQDIGRRRGVVWQAGRCIDMIYMDCIAPDYFAANP